MTRVRVRELYPQDLFIMKDVTLLKDKIPGGTINISLSYIMLYFFNVLEDFISEIVRQSKIDLKRSQCIAQQ